MCGPKALEELRASGQSYYRRIESKVCSRFDWDSLHQWKQEKEIKRRWIGRDIGWMSLSSSSSHWTNPLPGWRVAFGLPERTPAERYCPQDVVMWQPSWYGNITCHNPGHLRSINPWPRNLILVLNMSQQFGCRCRLNNGRSRWHVTCLRERATNGFMFATTRRGTSRGIWPIPRYQCKVDQARIKRGMWGQEVFRSMIWRGVPWTI